MNDSFAFSWDWKEQPNWAEISKVVNNLSEAGIPAYFYEVDTGSDDYGLLISMNEKEEDEIFDLWEGLLE